MRLGGGDYHEIAAAGGGILSSVNALRAAAPEDLEAQARRAVRQFVRHGATTVEAKSGYALDETGEMKTLVVMPAVDAQPLDIVPTYLGAHMLPPQHPNNPNPSIERISAHLMP